MSHNISSLGYYLKVFATLLILTAATVGAAFIDFGTLSTPIALTIAITKGLLVVLFFMHVWHSKKLTWLFAAAGFLWLIILIGMTFGDIVSRGWQGQPAL